MTDCHNYEHKLGLCLKLIDKEAFTDSDKNLIRGFIPAARLKG